MLHVKKLLRCASRVVVAAVKPFNIYATCVYVCACVCVCMCVCERACIALFAIVFEHSTHAYTHSQTVRTHA